MEGGEVVCLNYVIHFNVFTIYAISLLPKLFHNKYRYIFSYSRSAFYICIITLYIGYVGPMQNSSAKRGDNEENPGPKLKPF